ncbi:MAG: hypothetical protein QOJ72_1587 [Nocardioidaceae bacterium]|jgi:hypothetical protein|nr:hypothetical protein [Nocardioidaceae bacterium]
MIGRRAHDAQAFDEAWSGRTPRNAEIAELVQFAESICEAAVAEPSAEFRGALRIQLMTEAETALVPATKTSRPVTLAPTPRTHNVRRRIAGLTAAALVSVGTVGLVSSSASAVPGQLLYPLKRSVESVELAMHRGDASRGTFQLAQASERLAEARKLADDPSANNADLVASALDDFSSQARSGSKSLFNAYNNDGKQNAIQKVNDFAADATAQLATLSGVLPDSASGSFDSATQTISKLATRASTLCSACSTTDVQSLVSAVTSLSKVPPAKPASSEKPAADPASKPAASTPTSTPTQKPILSVPTTPSTTAPVTLNTVTDPLLGALLGDDSQQGLVPGLLNGLLDP